MGCLVPDRRGMGITSLGRDARGLTFSVVIPARVMQPGVSTRRKQNWRLAPRCYGMTFAPRHRVHRLCVASLAHLRCVHRLGCSLAGLWWRVRVGLAPGPPLNFKVRLFGAGGGPLECLFPYLEQPSHCNAFQAIPYSSGRLRHQRFDALGAWICRRLHPRGNLIPARAIPASQPAECHGLPSPPLRAPGPAGVQLLQRRTELDLR